jgi:hypothetical protein
MAQSMMTVSPKQIGLLPTVTSKVWGVSSLRQRTWPSKSSAASTAEPNATKTCLPSVQGVGAA